MKPPLSIAQSYLLAQNSYLLKGKISLATVFLSNFLASLTHTPTDFTILLDLFFSLGATFIDLLPTSSCVCRDQRSEASVLWLWESSSWTLVFTALQAGDVLPIFPCILLGPKAPLGRQPSGLDILATFSSPWLLVAVFQLGHTPFSSFLCLPKTCFFRPQLQFAHAPS